MANPDEIVDPTKLNSLQVLVVDQDKVIYEGKAESIIAPGENDVSIGILPFHTPFYTKLYKGELKIVKDKDEKVFQIESGIARVINNTVTILVGF